MHQFLDSGLRRNDGLKPGFSMYPGELAGFLKLAGPAVAKEVLLEDRSLTPEEKRASFAFLDTQDYAEGLAAFLEKRPPKFSGR